MVSAGESNLGASTTPSSEARLRNLLLAAASSLTPPIGMLPFMSGWAAVAKRDNAKSLSSARAGEEVTRSTASAAPSTRMTQIAYGAGGLPVKFVWYDAGMAYAEIAYEVL